MADAAVTFLLEQVTEVIKGYADLISGADKEFKKLRDDVDQLKAILKDTADKSSEDNAARLIKNEIREVIYEVEDAIDSWMTKTKDKSKIMRGVTKLSFDKTVKALREGQVKEMLEKAKEMKDALANVGTSSKEGQGQERRTVMVPTIRQERVVGLEDEEEIIINHLMKDQTGLDVISIIGMPGLGKTTLAWKVFSNDTIGFEFPTRIWVHFSEIFNCRDVLIQIMKKFTNNIEDLYSQTDQELSSAVFKCLSREKFLLVVDDVWETKHWDDIKNALPYRNGSGKVLITSREMKVGRHVSEITEPHQQKPLKSDKSWELLQWEVFGKIGSCPKELEKIGNHIAEKCEGIPLTIVVIGGVLKDQSWSSKPVDLIKEKWEKMASNVNLASADTKKVIADVVALSYKRLPDNLRDCFLYLGVIPAGYEIPTWTLTRLWIAEGFIQPADEKQSLEETAEEYLNDLIGRNLLIVRKTNPMHEVKACRVHDIIRVFCIDEASKQNLFQEIRMSDEEEDGALASKMQKIHRLCLHSDLDEFLLADVEGPRVRSFLCFRKDAMDLDPGYNSIIPDNFKLLRILQSKSIKFNKFPQNITKLIHLRYIVLCVPDLTLLPEHISQLWNLQTIVVDTHSDLITMKANIWKMMRLRHVKTKAAIVLLNKNEGEAGKNLQTLNRLSPESVTPVIAEKARNLKTLGIRGKLAPLFDDMHLEKLNRLEKLKLYQAATEKRLQCFPDSRRFPAKLKRLTLSNTSLDWNHMSTLAAIGDLQVLKLKNDAFKGVTWKSVNYVFKSLRFLLILIADVVVWEDSANAFPSLKHLELKNCVNLKEIPDSVLQNLENLDIDRVPKSIADSARKLGSKIKLSAGPGVI